MRVSRKFQLERIGHKYETLEIEVYVDTIEEAADKIEAAWRAYCKAVVEGRVQ